MADDVRNNFKEGLKAAYLRDVGTLEETEDRRSFEQTFSLFEKALYGCFNPSPDVLKELKSIGKSIGPKKRTKVK